MGAHVDGYERGSIERLRYTDLGSIIAVIAGLIGCHRIDTLHPLGQCRQYPCALGYIAREWTAAQL